MCVKLVLLLLECLGDSPACSRHSCMQTAVFHESSSTILCIYCLLDSSLFPWGLIPPGSHSHRSSCFIDASYHSPLHPLRFVSLAGSFKRKKRCVECREIACLNSVGVRSIKCRTFIREKVLRGRRQVQIQGDGSK